MPKITGRLVEGAIEGAIESESGFFLRDDSPTALAPLRNFRKGGNKVIS